MPPKQARSTKTTKKVWNFLLFLEEGENLSQRLARARDGVAGSAIGMKIGQRNEEPRVFPSRKCGTSFPTR